MNSSQKTFTHIALAALTMLTLSACGHSSSNNGNVAPTNSWAGTENLVSNTDYQGQLSGTNEKNIHQLMHQACGDQCVDYSPDAVVDFVLNPASNTATLRLMFPSRDGGPAAVTSLQVDVEPNRQGEELRFRSVDLSGRLQEGGRLMLSSRAGLIGDAQLGNL